MKNIQSMHQTNAMKKNRSTEKILKLHIKDCFKINRKERINMRKKGECVNFKNYERKIKLPFMIYANFEGNLRPEDNGNHETFY